MNEQQEHKIYVEGDLRVESNYLTWVKAVLLYKCCICLIVYTPFRIP